jgi:hypothetical protein
MKTAVNLVVLFLLVIFASGCRTGNKVDQSICTSATWYHRPQPQEVNTFAIVRLSTLPGPTPEARAVALQDSMTAQDKSALMAVAPEKAAFVETVVRDYLVLKGYKEVPGDQHPDIYVTAGYVDEMIGREELEVVVSAPRDVPVNPYAPAAGTGSPGATSGDANSHLLMVVVTAWVFDDKGACRQMWQGRSATDEGDVLVTESVDLAWAALDRFYSKTDTIRGSLNCGMISRGTGVAFSDMYAGGCSFRAGFRDGDILMEIDGRSFVEPGEVYAYCANRTAGATVVVKARHHGDVVVRPVKLGKRVLTEVSDL